MMVQVFIEHIVPLLLVQPAERQRFFSVEIILSQLLRPSEVVYQAPFFSFKILVVAHQEFLLS